MPNWTPEQFRNYEAKQKQPSNGPGVGAVQTPVAERREVQALACRPQKQAGRATGVVVVITFVSFRRRLLDSDNLAASGKALRDLVAKTLQVDDGDPRLRWCYEQIETKGIEGTLVKVDLL